MRVLRFKSSRIFLALWAVSMAPLYGPLTGFVFDLEAAVYYVDVNGNDQNEGSATAPWKTVNHAAHSVAAGDTVVINPGTYRVNSQISITTSGEPDNPIVFTANAKGVFLDCKDCPAKNSFEIYFADYITISNLTVRASSHAHSRGIRLTHADGVILRNNIVYGAGHANLFCSLSDQVIFANNTVYAGLIGIYVADSSDYTLVRGNRVYNNAAIGLHMNGDISCGGDGTISYATIEQNWIYNNGATGINCDGVTESLFRNNLLYENRHRGIAFFQQDGAVPSNDNEVYQNTIVMPDGGYYGIGLNYGVTRNRFYNNIIFTDGSVPCFSSTSSTSELDIASDYNLFPTRAQIGETQSGYYSFIGWRGLGYDSRSLTAGASRVFEDPTQNNYQLTATSPAIDAGAPAHTCKTDILGRKRPRGSAPDIGAYEFQPPTRVYVSPTGSCGGHSPYFTTIQAAIDTHFDQFAIRVKAGSYPEALILNKGQKINIQGGWNADFSKQDSTTTVQSLGILSGTITDLNLEIQ